MKRIAAATVLLLAGCGGVDYAPRGALPDVPETFVWPGWKDAENYELLVFRGDETLLFHAEGLAGTEHAIDRGLRRRLLGAREFTWMVRGWTAGEVVGKSERIPVRLESEPD